jgi:putative membrane protein
MQKNQILKRMMNVAALAMLFGASSTFAQSGTSQSESSDSKARPALQQQESSGASGASSAESKSGSSQMSKADQKMMRDIAQTNLAEIETGKLAQEKSQNEKVKEFAEKMVEDHTDAQEKLQELAEQKGVQLPSQPDKQHQAALKKMQNLSGDEFDKQYMAQGGLRDHRAAQKMLSRVEQRAQDEDLKKLASEMQPTINEHMKTARETHQEAVTSTGSSGTSGDSGSSQEKASGSSESSGSSGTDNSGSGTSGTGASSVKGTQGSSNSTGPGK